MEEEIKQFFVDMQEQPAQTVPLDDIEFDKIERPQKRKKEVELEDSKQEEGPVDPEKEASPSKNKGNRQRAQVQKVYRPKGEPANEDEEAPADSEKAQVEKRPKKNKKKNKPRKDAEEPASEKTDKPASK